MGRHNAARRGRTPNEELRIAVLQAVPPHDEIGARDLIDMVRKGPAGMRIGSNRTVYRILAELKEQGFINQRPTRKYARTDRASLGFEMWRIRKETDRMVTGTGMAWSTRLAERIKRGDIDGASEDESETFPVAYIRLLGSHAESLTLQGRGHPGSVAADMAGFLSLLGYLTGAARTLDVAAQMSYLKFGPRATREEFPTLIPDQGRVMVVASIDLAKLATWLRTPAGKAVVEYVFKEKNHLRDLLSACR